MTDAHAHFNTEHTGRPAAAGRYYQIDSIPSEELLPGLLFRPVLGERMLANFVRFGPGVQAPRHVHEEEQMLIVLEGEINFDLDGDVRLMRKGDVVLIPAWVPHGAWTTETECIEVDVFSPPRKTLIARANQLAED
jgi:quercetin dioxygenase-like cupin family protein